MEPIGTFIIPEGPNGITCERPYYGIRYNKDLAHLSTKELGWQIFIDGVVGMRWINIELGWLCQ